MSSLEYLVTKIKRVLFWAIAIPACLILFVAIHASDGWCTDKTGKVVKCLVSDGTVKIPPATK